MRILMTSAAAVIALAAAAHAQEATTPTPGADEGATEAQTQQLPSGITIIAVQEEGQVLANELVGTDIVNGEGETIGEITDLLMSEDGNVIGSVVSVGGFLGIGAKEVALPQDEIQFRRDEDGALVASIAVTREELEAGPDFMTLEEAVAAAEQERLEAEMATDQTGMAPTTAPAPAAAPAPVETAEADAEPDAATTEGELASPAAPATEVAETPAATAPAGEMTPDRASLEELLGKPVEAADGQALGTVADVVVAADGAVEFVIVESEGKLTAVSWDRIEAPQDATVIIADTTPAEIEQMPAYEYTETDDTLTRPLAR